MGVKVHGVNQLLKELDSRLGKANIDKASDAALTAGSLVFGMELRRQLQTFRDTGATIDELTISAPSSGELGSRSVQVYWRGPKSRYRIIHLNEWGTIRNPSPKGKHKIAKAMKVSQRAYGQAIRDSLRRNI